MPTPRMLSQSSPLTYGGIDAFNRVLSYTPTEEGWVVPEELRLSAHKTSRPSRLAAPPRFVFHSTELVFPTQQRTRQFFDGFKTPPHLWQSNSGENSIAYPMKVHGSRERIAATRFGKQPPASRERTPGPPSAETKGHNSIYQRIPFDRIGWALRGTKRSGIETNHMGYCGQVEIEGYAADTKHWSDWSLAKTALSLIKFAEWVRLYHDPTWLPSPYQNEGRIAGSYGVKGAARMTKEEWATGRCQDGRKWSVCTHQNVPGNTHWDCGALDLARVCDIARDHLLAPAGPAAEVVPIPPAKPTPAPTEPEAKRTQNIKTSLKGARDALGVLDRQLELTERYIDRYL